MKKMLLGISILLFGISIVVAGPADAMFFFVGWIFSAIGIAVSISGYFSKE